MSDPLYRKSLNDYQNIMKTYSQKLHKFLTNNN